MIRWSFQALMLALLLGGCQSGSDDSPTMPSSMESASADGATQGGPEAKPSQPSPGEPQGEAREDVKAVEYVDPVLLKATFEEFTVLFEQFGGVIQSNDGDCAAMGAALDVFAAQHAARFKEAGVFLRNVPKETLNALEDSYSARLDAAQKLFNPLGTCGQEPTVKAALGRLM